MINIATTNSNIPLVVHNLLQSIKRNCSQDFMLHVCNSAENCNLKIFSNEKQIRFYEFYPKSEHSSVRHADALNYIKNLLPQNEYVVICDADIYMYKSFDILLADACRNGLFVATENSGCTSLPHPTLFYGKMKTLVDYNVDFSAIPKLVNGRHIVTRHSETGHKLQKIPNWIHLTQQPDFKPLGKATSKILLKNHMVALHFKSGRKYDGSAHFEEWVKYCANLKSLR